ncbi:MAG: glycosyltransferase [Myxococcales bacterium]
MDDFFVYLLVLLVLTNRYVAGHFLKRLTGARFDEKREDYEPTVATITPLFNEGDHIVRTVESLLALDYPKDKLEIIIVDDCSTDDSYAWALKAARGHPNVKVLRNPVNVGKRKSINRGHRETKAEIIVSVDSDVVVDRGALRALVARFTRPEIAAVGGRVMVANPNDNWLTRMQTVKFYFAQEWLKLVERAFKSVMCLSGCLTAYRREVLEELQPVLEGRNVLGVPIKYGEDRFLTRQIVKAGYKTLFITDAWCFTVSPNTLSKYFSQQIRWRRSNLIDWFGGLRHAWRLPAPVALNYFSLFALMLCYPLLILEKVLNGDFVDLVVIHAGALALLAAIYYAAAGSMPESQRVGPLAFISMALLMPVSYLVFTPLGLFTLDSGSWETRSKPTPSPVPPSEVDPSTADRVVERESLEQAS